MSFLSYNQTSNTDGNLLDWPAATYELTLYTNRYQHDSAMTTNMWLWQYESSCYAVYMLYDIITTIKQLWSTCIADNFTTTQHRPRYSALNHGFEDSYMVYTEKKKKNVTG